MKKKVIAGIMIILFLQIPLQAQPAHSCALFTSGIAVASPVEPPPTTSDWPGDWENPESDFLYPQGSTLEGTTMVVRNIATGVISLRFEGDEVVEYRINPNNPAVAKGLLRIYEAERGVFPVYAGGLMINDGDGNAIMPEDYINQSNFTCNLGPITIYGNKVTLPVTDTIECDPGRFVYLSKTYEIELIGKSLRIHCFGTSPRMKYKWNYSGFTFGSGKDPVSCTGTSERIIIPYMETMGTTLVNNDFFYQTFVDYTQSNGSDPKRANPFGAYMSGIFGRFVNSIDIQYKRLGGEADPENNTLNPVDETVWVTVTSNVDDMFVLGTAPDESTAPDICYRDEFINAFHTCYSGISPGEDNIDDFNNFKSCIEELHRCGVRDQKVSIWHRWENGIIDYRDENVYTPFPAVLPPYVYENTDPRERASLIPGGWEQDFRDMISSVKDRYGRIALYLYYYTQNEQAGNPSVNPYWPEGYSADWAASDQEGNPKISKPAPANWISHFVAADAMKESAAFWDSKIRDELGINWCYVDSVACVFPGNQMLTEWKPAGHDSKIRDAIISVKEFFLQTKDTYAGPHVSEGNLAMANLNVGFDTFYKGYLDVFRRHLGFCSWIDTPPDTQNNDHYYIIPDFELKAFKPFSIGQGFGTMGRFQDDEDDVPPEDDSFPWTGRSWDEYAATIISYNHNWGYGTSGLQIFSGTGDALLFPDIVKGYYMLSADLQGRYLTSDIETIEYCNGVGSYTLSDALRNNLDLVHPRLKLTYEDGLTIWINHDNSPGNLWTVIPGNGVTYSLPEFGWLAYDDATPGELLLEFSGIPSDGPQHRFDYVYSERHGFTMIDGRGTSTTYTPSRPAGIQSISAIDFKVMIDLPSGVFSVTETAGSFQYQGSLDNVLTMNVNGGGTTNPAPAPAYHGYDKRDLTAIVMLSATPAEGWEFDRWEGGVANPAQPETQVVMDQDQIVTAFFNPELEIDITPGLQIMVTSNPPQTDDGFYSSNVVLERPLGSIVNLRVTAIPTSMNWQYWDVDGNHIIGTVINVSMDSPHHAITVLN
ncbi:MAG: hypothetical protein ABIK28_14450 [Planctomycetota bacterium]